MGTSSITSSWKHSNHAKTWLCSWHNVIWSKCVCPNSDVLVFQRKLHFPHIVFGMFSKIWKIYPIWETPHHFFNVCLFHLLQPEAWSICHTAQCRSEWHGKSQWMVLLKNWLVQAKYKYYNIRLKCSTAPKYSLTEIRWCYFKGCSAFYLRVVDLLLVFRALKRCVEVQPSSPGRQGERNCFWMDKQQTRPIGCHCRHFSRCTCACVRSSPPPVNTRCFCANKEIGHLTITCVRTGFC